MNATSDKPSFVQQFVSRYQQWSRLMQILFWVAILLIAYLAVIDPMWDNTGWYARSADALEQDISVLRTEAQRNQQVIEQGRKQWGPIILPAKAAGSANVTLQKVLTSVLESHGIQSGITIKDLASDSLEVGKKTGAGKAGNGDEEQQVLRLTQVKTQVQFSAGPDVVTAVLADLEKNPNVACIQRLSLRKDTRRPILEVTLVAQAWQRA